MLRDDKGAKLGGHCIEAVVAPYGKIVRDVVIGGRSVEGDGYRAGRSVDLVEDRLVMGSPLGDAATAAVEEYREAGTRDVILKL